MLCSQARRIGQQNEARGLAPASLSSTAPAGFYRTRYGPRIPDVIRPALLSVQMLRAPQGNCTLMVLQSPPGPGTYSQPS